MPYHVSHNSYVLVSVESVLDRFHSTNYEHFVVRLVDYQETAANPTPYGVRGWCSFESTVAAIGCCWLGQ